MGYYYQTESPDLEKGPDGTVDDTDLLSFLNGDRNPQTANNCRASIDLKSTLPKHGNNALNSISNVNQGATTACQKNYNLNPIEEEQKGPDGVVTEEDLLELDHALSTGASNSQTRHCTVASDQPNLLNLKHRTSTQANISENLLISNLRTISNFAHQNVGHLTKTQSTQPQSSQNSVMPSHAVCDGGRAN